VKRLAILQSNYLPWKGYFDLIDRVDEFIVYDSAQYTKNDWRNRNLLKGRDGPAWITVPVRVERLGQAIDEVRIADPRCFAKHFRTFLQTYARSARIDFCRDALGEVFQAAGGLERLSEVNACFIRRICELVGIDTRIRDAREFEVTGDRTERLVSLCRQAGADRYLSGPAARSYLDESLFEREGIRVEWMEYDGYPEYPQPHPPFDHRVSILDLLAHAGPDAMRYVRDRSRR
jgi:hypothetical protein